MVAVKLGQAGCAAKAGYVTNAQTRKYLRRYLFPTWCIGFILRHLILFPLRLLLIFMVMTSFFGMFIPLHILLKVRFYDLQKSMLQHTA